MGARVAWALAHALRERGLPAPQALHVACCAAPGSDPGPPDWTGRDADLTRYLRELGGTPDEVLAEPTLMAGLLPVLRADLAVLGGHRGFRPAAPLDVPIHAYAGRDDREVPAHRMRGWAAETGAGFALHEVTGGHFFDPAGEQQVIDTIAAGLGPR
jgi:surfactin synthase thioesterase subunit